MTTREEIECIKRRNARINRVLFGENQAVKGKGCVHRKGICRIPKFRGNASPEFIPVPNYKKNRDNGIKK